MEEEWQEGCKIREINKLKFARCYKGAFNCNWQQSAVAVRNGEGAKERGVGKWKIGRNQRGGELGRRDHTKEILENQREGNE